MPRLLTILLLLIAVSCREDAVDVTVPVGAPQLSPEEAQVIANCEAVRDAAEAFAAENGGRYPNSVDLDQSLAGNTLLDLLPGSTHLVNPFTGDATEPVDGTDSGRRGETSYAPLSSGTGYVVTGYGNTFRIYHFQK